MRNSTTGSILGVAMLAMVFAGSAAAQNGRSAAATSSGSTTNHIGMVQDWSQQSVIFSNPDTPEEARAKGRMQRWNRLAADPRFMSSLIEKLEYQAEQAERRTTPNRPRPNPIPGPTPTPTPTPAPVEGSMHRDWSNVLGGGANGNGGSGASGMRPAKYNFNTSATPSCADDFVVYGTEATGVTASGTGEQWVATFTTPAQESWSVTFNDNGGLGQTSTAAGQNIVIDTVTLQAANNNTGLNFDVSGNRNADRDSLVTKINNSVAGYSAVAGGNGEVIITRAAFGNVANGTVNENMNQMGNAVATDGASSDPVAGETVVIGNTAPRTVTLTASSSVNSGLNFQFAGNETTNASNLAAAVNRWSGQTGFRATTDGAATVTITANTTSNVTQTVTEGLTNFGGFTNTNGSGTAGQPTIIAFNKLYNGYCATGGADTGPDRTNDNAPDVFWSYNTTDPNTAAATAIVETSPTLSYFDNAKQVAFIQRNANPNPDTLQLVLLKWSSASPGTAAAPTAPTTVTPANYRSCTAPCMTIFTLSGTSNTNGAATFSSPFVDYFNDTLWVGDGNSRLHKFTGVFQGTPAEVTTGGFPVAVSATAGLKLSSPVYDFSGSVFIGSSSGGAGVGGMLHRINASTAAVVSSGKLSGDNNTGVRASPMLDVSTAHAFAFVSKDNSNGCSGGTDTDCQAVYQFATNFAATTTGTRGSLGAGFNSVPTYGGAFDRDYFSSPTHDGAIYSCGSTTTSNSTMVLYRIPLTGGVMGTPVQGGTVGTGTSGSCSPVTQVKNGTNKYLYVSVPDNGSAAGCSGACLYMFNLGDLNGAAAGTGAAWGTTNAASAALASPGGTTGLIIDNLSTLPGTSQVYYSNLAAPGNAVQASQSGLQ